MSAGKHYLHLAGRIANIKNQAANAIAGLELLARNLLAARHESFNALNLHHEGAALVTSSGAGDEFALALAEFFEERVALVFTEALDHDLLGGLRWNATERLQVNIGTNAVFVFSPQRDSASGAIDLASKVLGVE